MKKILTIILSIITVFSLVGCGGAITPPLNIDTIKPWHTTTKYEKTTYKVEKYAMKTEKDAPAETGDLIASGTLTFTISPHESIDDVSYSQLDTDFTLTYDTNEAVPELDRGLSDNIKSTIIFQDSSLSPYSSIKEVKLAPRKDTFDRSYKINANYASNVKKATFTRGEQTKEVELIPKSSQYIFDNEQLYFVVRAMSGLKYNTQNQFTLANTFDMFSSPKKPKWQTYNMKANVATDKDKKLITVDSLASKYGLDEKGTLTCMKVNVGINGKKAGPDKIAYYAETQLNVNEEKVSKLLVQLVEKEYEQAKEKYNLIYTLTDYTNLPPSNN